MPHFQRKPLVVEAVKFDARASRERTPTGGIDLDTGVAFVNGIPSLLTSDGVKPVLDGDWIVVYADGQQEVWRPSAFLATWEQVT